MPSALVAQSILDLPPAAPGKRVAYGDSEFQFAELHLPEARGPHPVAMVIHGGFWRARYDLRHIGHFCVALAKQGIAAYSVEYRRIGNPGGGYPGTLDDIRAAAVHLAKLDSIDPKRIVVTGHSAGGHLCLWLAQQKAIALRGIVPLAPVSDLRKAYELKLSNTVVGEFLGGSPEQFPDRYRAASPMENVPLGAWSTIFHGERDREVPVSMSRAYAAASGKQCTLITPDCGHYELIDPRSTVWPQIRDTIAGLVK
jgi:acetyl esterase/lipase